MLVTQQNAQKTTNLSDRLLRVLLVVTDLDIGGTPLQVYRLARGLNELGVDVSVSCLGPSGPVSDKIRNLGVPVYPLGAKSVADLGVFRRLTRLIRQIKPDICHSFLMHANVSTRLAGVFARSAIISTLCTVEREKKWHMILETLTARLADRIVCISEAVKRHGLKWHLPADRLSVIHPGIDLERIISAPAIDSRTLGLTPNSTKIAYLGRLDPIKRVDLILQAVEHIHRKLPQIDLNALIIGDGPERRSLEQLAERLGISDRVKFLGFREDFPQILKICKLFVLASRQEGWGIATTEALAAGLKVVATNVDANPEQIQNGINGILVESDNLDSLAEGIQAGLRLAEVQGSHPVTLDIDALSYQREAREYLDLYRHLLKIR